ncbi:MAG TPA: NAD(P)-dependent oxidoreductase [Pirellulaceae bacterium]|nr:NAD(P)-dependent oxidoreductase [Pirellulaceae bacterium]
MKAFVTGITGFSGGHLAERLASQGWSVAGSSLHGSWSRDYAPERPERFPLFRWDVSDPAPGDVRNALAVEPPDAFFHLAGISTPSLCGRYSASPEAVAVNAAGPLRAAETLLAAAPAARFVFVSSCLVYGDSALDGRPVAEECEARPSTPYGQTKLEAERRLAEFASTSGLDLRIARSFQHAGPRQKRPRIVPDWAAQFATDAPVVEVFSLDAELDLSDIRDVARAYELLATHDRPPRILNVASGRRTTGRELLAAMQRLAPPPREIRELRPGVSRQPIGDVSLIARTLGWSADTPLETTLRDALVWERNRLLS